MELSTTIHGSIAIHLREAQTVSTTVSRRLRGRRTGVSLLSVCGDGKVESGNPTQPFYANDLPKDVSDKAWAICTAAGVKEGPLLDACILDVAVIGNETAANVYVGAPAPVAVATPLPR